MTRGASKRNLLWWLTLGYTAFVIYGSLVPLRFRARPLDEAWAYFQQIPYLELGIGSRADWVANILLFVPLAFLWHRGIVAESWVGRQSACLGFRPCLLRQSQRGDRIRASLLPAAYRIAQ